MPLTPRSQKQKKTDTLHRHPALWLGGECRGDRADQHLPKAAPLHRERPSLLSVQPCSQRGPQGALSLRAAPRKGTGPEGGEAKGEETRRRTRGRVPGVQLHHRGKADVTAEGCLAHRSVPALAWPRFPWGSSGSQASCSLEQGE